MLFVLATLHPQVGVEPLGRVSERSRQKVKLKATCRPRS